MPVVLKKITRQYKVVCDECEARIGFVADEVTQRVLYYYDDSELVNFVQCPVCKSNIRLKSDYKKKLKSTEI